MPNCETEPFVVVGLKLLVGEFEKVRPLKPTDVHLNFRLPHLARKQNCQNNEQSVLQLSDLSVHDLVNWCHLSIFVGEEGLAFPELAGVNFDLGRTDTTENQLR